MISLPFTIIYGIYGFRSIREVGAPANTAPWYVPKKVLPLYGPRPGLVPGSHFLGQGNPGGFDGKIDGKSDGKINTIMENHEKFDGKIMENQQNHGKSWEISWEN